MLSKKIRTGMGKLLGSLGLSLLALNLSSGAMAQAPLLKAGARIFLPHTQGKFDFSELDTARHRLLLAHTGNKTLDVVDLSGRRLLKSVPTGAAQDSAVDAQHGLYYVSVSSPPSLVIVDANKLQVTASIKLPAESDLLAYNPANGLVYVCNDTAGELWVIDPAAKKIIQTIALVAAPVRGMEGLVFDVRHKLLYQAVSQNNTLYVIDLVNNKVLNSWPVLPAASPHGIALLPDGSGLLVAGGTGTLALLNSQTGKVVSSVPIDQRSDQIAFDPQRHRLYSPGASGTLSIIGVQGNTLSPLGSVTGAAGRNIVVDPITHMVWIASANDHQCYVQSFVPTG